MLKNADRHLERVIHRTISLAELGGQDYTTQNEVAVRAVRWTKPDMTVTKPTFGLDGPSADSAL